MDLNFLQHNSIYSRNSSYSSNPMTYYQPNSPDLSSQSQLWTNTGINSGAGLALTEPTQTSTGSSLPAFNRLSIANSYHNPNHTHRNAYPLTSTTYYEQYAEPASGLPSYLMNSSDARRNRLPSASASLTANMGENDRGGNLLLCRFSAGENPFPNVTNFKR
ncbi:hypothetical protein HHI36_004362 [Cryptolaemus montrouzieri]|uniref:Uncharacterized protein n=1 Tax=Cryptolaemus montrouzieri TaxID=559131 RepID=A0ABD2NRS4_9CUCU